MSICKEALAPGIAAFEKVTNAGRLCELVDFSDVLKTLCEGGENLVQARVLLPLHEGILCAVLCCCHRRPKLSKKARNLHQECVRETLDEVDALMKGKSRFKAEVSYNMRANPPVPLMDTDSAGNLNTRPLKHPDERWRMIARMERDYPGVKPLHGRETRRPDVVIVRDPAKPPTRNNLVKVVEMKFPGDSYYEDAQELAYDAIDPTGDTLVLDVEKCCKKGKRKKTEEAIKVISAADELVQSDAAFWERVGYGTAAVGLVALGIALIFVPWDGTGGESAAGAGAMEMATLAGGEALMTELIKEAARVAAAWRYTVIFGGAGL